MAITIKKLKLKKQNKPDFDELERMICNLKEFLSETPDFNDAVWMQNLNELIEFQDDDGSFKLFTSFKIPADARVDFIYTPTYLASAALMKAYLLDGDAFTIREKTALMEGLKFSCARKLRGHGYEALKGQIEALNIFMHAGLREFLELHSDICPDFSQMIGKIISEFAGMVDECKFTGPWGESYEEEIIKINQYFSTRDVFVYGTLMRDEANHHFLNDSDFKSKAFIEGYEIYDVGFYPAIVAGEGIVPGELYTVPSSFISSIDMLEGEGSLYLKKCSIVTDADANNTLAFVYVYLRSIDGLERISAWRDDYVWYASYGSNMLKERFLCYIKGGSFEDSRYHPPCDDAAPPLAVRAIEIPYSMYFANTSGSWHGSGVSFLDVTQPGNALGVAYLITREQFEHVCERENGGREPQPGCGWYEDIIDLGVMDGFEVKTLTNRHLLPYNEPCPEYLETLKAGIKENWPVLSDSEIDDYLKSSMR